jgi:hypothetical protein
VNVDATVEARVKATVGAMATTPAASTPSTARGSATATASAIQTSLAFRPLSTPTVASVDLVSTFEDAWAKRDWPRVHSVLDQLELVAPSAVDVKDKRYVAHFFAAQELVERGDRANAAKEFDLAMQIDPSRGEARDALVALTPTPTPVPPTETPIPRPATATPVPVPSRAQARYIDPRVLVSDAKQHVGENVWLQGRALTVSHNDEQRGLFSTTPAHSWIQLMAQVEGRTTTESIVVRLYPKDSKVLGDECYRVFGIVTGTETVTRTLTGASNDVPTVRGYAWEKAPSARIGCAQF